MIRLRAIGDCAIDVGDLRITPESDVLFALLLYLASKAGRPTSRAELVGLLWPACDRRRASHRLRQAVYQLRKLGVTIRTNPTTVTLDRLRVELDYGLPEQARLSALTAMIHARPIEVLPYYGPNISAPFAQWVESERDKVRGILRRDLHALIVRKRLRGEYADVIAAAHACLEFDPLNRDATLALAEAHALLGNNVEAVAVLDEYRAELPQGTSEASRAAEQLKRRLVEIGRMSRSEERTGSELVGRDEILKQLACWATRCTQGAPRVVVLSGEAGIGKTRLLNEGVRVCILSGCRCVLYRPSASGEERPLAGILDLLPKLLALPGAVGCSPESFSRLSQLARGVHSDRGIPEDVSDSAFRYTLLRRSVLDLVDAILAESELVVAIDDAHSLDSQTLEILLDAVRANPERIGLLVALRPLGDIAAFVDAQPAIQIIRIPRLGAAAARALVVRDLSEPMAAERSKLIDWAVDLANGNPFFLVELSAHCTGANPSETLPQSLQIALQQKLDALSPTARLLVQACAVLGENSTLSRLESVLALPPHVTASALSQLEACGLIDARDGAVKCHHDLIADEVVRSMGAGCAGYLHRRCAVVLDREIQSSPVATVAWDCALHWAAAGEHDRALELTVFIADQLLVLGLPEAAAELCTKAERYCRTPHQHAERLLRLSHALKVLNDWDGVVRSLDQRRALRSGSLARDERYSDDDIALFEAQWWRAFDTTILEPAIERLNDAAAPSIHRLQVGVLALIIADNFQRARDAARIVKVVDSIDPTTPREDLEKSKAALIYHTAFGNLDVAVSAADRVVGSERLGGNLAALPKALRWASVPLKYTNDLHGAISALTESYHWSQRLGLRSEMWNTATYLTDLALDCEDKVLASEWAPRCLELAAESPNAGGYRVARSSYVLARTEFMKGNLAEASRLLADCRRLRAEIPGTRGEESLIALDILLRMHQSVRIPRRMIGRLRRLHLRSRGSGVRDFETGALLAGLSAIGESNTAQHLRAAYFRGRRCRLPVHSLLAVGDSSQRREASAGT